MKRARIAGAGLLILLPAVGAGASAEFGLRLGTAHASEDLFRGSGDLGQARLFGLHLGMEVFPEVEIEMAYERRSREFAFRGGVFEDRLFGGRGEFGSDLYLLTAKFHLPMGASGTSLFAGGGTGVESVDLSVRSDDPSVEAYAAALGGERNDFEWHLVAGGGIRIPAAPLRAFGEYRFLWSGGSRRPSLAAFYAGLNFFVE